MKDKSWVQRVELLALVVTLVLLIVEVRGNTKAIERQILLDRTANVVAPFLDGPVLFQAFEQIKSVDGWEPGLRGLMEQYGLEPSQAVAWHMFLLKNWRDHEADYAYGGPSDDLARSIRGALAFPDSELFWRLNAFSPDFTAYVESVAPGLAEGDG